MRTTLAISFLAVMLLSCSKSMVTVPTPAQIGEFSRNASVSLPASAQPLGWHQNRGMDDGLWLQFRIPRADFQTFLDSSPFRSASLSTNDRYCINLFKMFWAAPPLRYRAGQQTLPNARVLNLLVDESDATNAVVYLMWHET